MKIGIVYASKYGFTEECALYLKDKLQGEVKLIDVKEQPNSNLAEFDWVILGSSVYMSNINKDMKKFVEANIEVLLAKKVALFVCCMTPKEADNYMKEGYTLKLYEAAKYKANFGGKLEMDKMNFFERGIIKMVNKSKDPNSPERVTEILYDEMDKLVDTIRSSKE